jgi:hypothetical protein
MKQYRYLLILLLLASCNTNKHANKTLSEETKLIASYSKMTENNKIEYKIDLFSNKQMYLTAIKNIDKNGRYLRFLSNSEYNSVIKTFKESSFFSFKNSEDTSSCVSTRRFYFTNNNKEKQITVCASSNELKNLEFIMQSFLDRVGWEKISW